MTTVPANIRQFANTRETSDEVALAIFELAVEGDEARIWENPTEDEMRTVVARAFALAPGEDVLHWGVEVLRRPT